jgi:NADPH:quinone reductase-like Zn-dependent oxidoreductase
MDQLIKKNDKYSLLHKKYNIIEVVMPGIVEPSGLLILEKEIESPKAGQALIKVEASGISFAEQAMRRDRYPGQPKFPFVPGYDFVGTVVAAGEGVDTAMIGKRYAAITKTGGWATMTIVDAENLLLVPDDVSAIDAEAIVVNGITAWQMLYRIAVVKSGQTIFVHGANGGVGTLLVQLAQLSGIKVVGSASSRHHAALTEQGVIPVDYNDPNLEGTVRSLVPDGFDAVFDNVGFASVSISFKVLKKGGTLVSYAISSSLRKTDSVVLQFLLLVSKLMLWNILPNGKKATFYNVWSGKGSNIFKNNMRQDFASLAKLLGDGSLKARIAKVFPLNEVAKAMAFAESRTAYGKVILVPEK